MRGAIMTRSVESIRLAYTARGERCTLLWSLHHSSREPELDPMASSVTLKKRFRAHGAILPVGISVLALLAWSPAMPAAGPQQVDLKLVLATDVSGSIDNDELKLEREGTADAFLDPDVIKAIKGGALGRIAVAMIDFSSPEYDKVVIDWHIIQDAQGAAAFAGAIRELPRTPGRRTSVSSALELGSLLLEAS